MRTSPRAALGFRRVPIYAVAFGIAWSCRAGTLDVQVVDADGHPIPGVAVYAVPTSPELSTRASPSTATMDQQHNAFVPHMLIVQTGTLVDFPNNDTVSHHVYSFSDAKTFELGLYKGDAHPPLLFDHPGVVVLGCNIHDSMLGYILVVDTPYFARTAPTGRAELETVKAGRYAVHVWTPRARPKDLPDSITAAVGAGDTKVEFRIAGKLLPDHDQSNAGLTWERY